MRLFFDGFEIDRETCRLIRDGVVVPLEPRVFDLLCYFVAHPKRVILKDELLVQVWQARSLSDGVLANAPTKLRKALGQPPDAREPLETVRGRGYCFHATPRGPTAEVSVPAGAVPNDQFVGRGYVLAQLMAALDRAASGIGQLFVVAGEPGIGKTRAVSEFNRLAEARGSRCWWGVAFDGDVAPAYWPWIEILRAAHRQLSANEWQRVLPASRAALAQLAPELGTSSSPSADAQTLRFKLFEEVTWRPCLPEGNDRPGMHDSPGGPHNLEGSALYAGDFYARAQGRDHALRWYMRARSIPSWDSWRYQSVIEERIRTLDERIAAAVTPSLDDDLPSVWSSETGCTMCHAK